TGAAATPSTPAAAPAGTLVFIKNHNVWMARGDGSGQVQITKDGTADDDYSMPSMPRAGVVAAIRGDSQIVHTKTDGTRVGAWDAKTLFPVCEAIYQDTTSLDISPDGAKAAYGMYAYVELWKSAVGARYSTAHALSSLADGQLYFSDQKWITNNRVLLRNKGGIYLQDVGSSNPVEWFQEAPYFKDPADDWYINEDLFEP